ncbi:FUSC family protein [Rhizobiaceae bacterium n13]|uniref:FUSC family protein n=1 Tax=Ferirhizobium litorale TaxID=2927786 RepID=A0AAE3U5N8_9HYPH|nr:FUSC family protein [Fererhizobium litorale]MDI7863914.1 FUSC family protein [Fererhizobium litorale]MDI7924254.1 FUSC family protein [Fererhizobium litorale]
MGYGARLRDWLLANDPAFTRLHLAIRVTLSIGLSVLVMLAIHRWLMPMPAAAYSLCVLLSIQGGLSVKDSLPSEQMKTRLLAVIASVAVTSIAAALDQHRALSDAVFLVVIFLVSYGRVYGQRWFAVGMFAFMSYFSGIYFRPAVAEIPFLALGALVAAAVSHAVRVLLVPDNWRRDLIAATQSVLGHVDLILAGLSRLAIEGKASERSRAELFRLEERLKASALMADSLVPISSSIALPGEGNPGSDFVLRLFDLHLAAESAILMSLRSVPNAALVNAMLRHDDGAIEREAATVVSRGEGAQAETAKAMLWLRDARKALTESMAQAKATAFAGYDDRRPPPARGLAPGLSLDKAALRVAIQITLASGVAMVFGLMLSRERWFWAVITAFLVFTNTTSRGDATVKAVQRTMGTLVGIVIGMGLGIVLAGHNAALVGAMVACTFLGFYFVQVSYAVLTFFVTIVLCLIYSLTGNLTLSVVELRIEETLVGAAVGSAVAYLVFPVRTHTMVRSALEKWFAILRQLLETAEKKVHGPELVSLSIKLDNAYRDLVVAARPLDVSWQLVTRPGQVRQTLALFRMCTYWARIFAQRLAFSDVVEDSEVDEKIKENLARLERVAARGAACFSVERGIGKTGSRELPLSRGGSRLGIQMIGATLDRLYPQSEH